MKLTFLFTFLTLCSLSHAQYFNIVPNIVTEDSTQFHYAITGIQNFPDTAVLNVELITDYETMGLAESRLFDLSDSLTWSGFTKDTISNEFSIDLGVFDVNNLILHMWIVVNDETFDEIYYQQ